MEKILYSDVIPHFAEYGGLVFILFLMLGVSLYFNWYLVKRNTALADKMIDVTERSILALAEFKDKMDDVIRQKN